MFLLYSILFGECCCNNGWNRGSQNCGCERNWQNCGCGRDDRSGQNCGCNNGCGRTRQCCGDSFAAETEFFSNDCCCNDRCCSGFGRHGGFSVCCDEEYYNRQYALCRCCKCNSRNSCGCRGNNR